MIEINKLTKNFDTTVALNSLSCQIKEGSIVGLTGSNGSGKSTMLRTLSGVYKPDGGEVIIDKENAYDNGAIKERCFYISDYPYFFNDSTVNKLADFFRTIYKNWNDEVFKEMISRFSIQTNERIVNMSKGMQRQASLILAFSTMPKYMFLDEIFDGLDPVMRQVLKKIIIENVADNKMTCIIASHNMREIDDICDSMIMLHKGEVVANNETDQLKGNINKIQLAFNQQPDGDLFVDMDVQILSQIGGYYNIMARGDIDKIMEKLNALNPSFIEVIPSTLEEVFINEMEGVGYGK